MGLYSPGLEVLSGTVCGGFCLITLLFHLCCATSAFALLGSWGVPQMSGLFSLALLKCWGFVPLSRALLWCVVLDEFPEGLVCSCLY